MHYVQLFDERRESGGGGIGTGVWSGDTFQPSGGGGGSGSWPEPMNVRIVCNCGYDITFREARLAIRQAERHVIGHKGIIMYNGLSREFK